MANKKIKQDREIEKHEGYIRQQVFGNTSDRSYHLEALGRKLRSNGELAFASQDERMDALCRLVLRIADDVSNIYSALEIHQKLSGNLRSQQVKLIHTLAVSQYNHDEAEKAEKKRLRESKKMA